MDHGSATGLFGAAYAIARSFQPNLLTRRSTDQAIITGTSAATAYGLFSAGDAFIAALASRISRDEHPGPIARGAVATALGAAGAAAVAALPWREHEPNMRTAARVTGQIAGAVALASMGSTLVVHPSRRRNGLAVAGVATAAGAAAWAAARTWKARPGSLVQAPTPGAVKSGEEYYSEDTVRQVAPLKAIGISAGVAAGTLVLAKAESRLTNAATRGATALLGGEPQDHRMLGRMTTAAVTLAFGWFAVAKASDLLSKGGDAIEPGHAQPPTAPEITGSPASGLPWDDMTREGARWLSMALEPAGIESVMGITGARQPIRVYASLRVADTEQERAEVLLSEIDRTRALERKVFVLFSPTGSGYVNYVATETLEYLTGGDCASAAIQYSVLPSALSLNDVPEGTAQTRMVLNGITERILAMPEDKRPRFYLFGESLGSQVSEEMFRGTGPYGLLGTCLTGAIWIGTPMATVWRRELWGDRTIADAPDVGPGSIYLPRSIDDWRALPAEERAQVRFLLLQNGDDPIPKFGPQLAWRRPDWLGPEDIRPAGAPRGTRWVPGQTYLTTFFDMQSALLPTPGVFSEGGHDYRYVLPEAISQTWELPASPQQFDHMNQALRQRELAWELHRRLSEALDQRDGQRKREAIEKLLASASEWVGHPVTEDDVQALIEAGLQPR